MDLSDFHCMRCGQAKGKDISLWLTGCKHILCSSCVTPDGRGHLFCCLCRNQCSATQLKGSNIPEKLRPLLRNSNDLISCFSRAHVLQNRLKDNKAQRIKQRKERLSSKLETMDKEANCLTFLSRKSGKFLGKFERSCNAGKMTPKFRSALETFSEIDVETELEDFLTNFSDTSDTASTDEAEDQTDTGSVRERGHTRPTLKEKRPERARAAPAKHNQHPKRQLEAPRRSDSPGVVRDQHPAKRIDRERPPNPERNFISRPAASPAPSKHKPHPINPTNRGTTHDEPREARFESNRGSEKKHSKAKAPDSRGGDPARQLAQTREPAAARDPARHPQRGIDSESHFQRQNHAMRKHRESNIPRRRKYDGAFAD